LNETPTPRDAARVVLLDRNDRVFLMRFIALERDAGFVWISPGGGLKDGESHEQAAVRELSEEIGLRDAALGPCLWLRTHVFRFAGTLYEQRERYYLCRIDSHDLGDHLNEDEAERQSITDHRWWSIDEIEASSETFVPRALAVLLRELLRGKVLNEPFVVDIEDG
jgi:8-oxo-dGTP pyrophosphatase MutT (NUDIX family)